MPLLFDPYWAQALAANDSIATARWGLLAGQHVRTNLAAPFDTERVTLEQLGFGVDVRVTLTVTDSDNSTGSTSMVLSANRPPIAVVQPASAKVLADTGLTLRLNGGKSKDTDGAVTRFQWRIVSKPAAEGRSLAELTAGLLSTPQAAATTMDVSGAAQLTAGTYNVELRVWDDRTANSTFVVPVQVLAVLQVPATSGKLQAVAAGASDAAGVPIASKGSVSLRAGSGTAFGPGVRITSLTWSCTGYSTSLSDAERAQATAGAPLGGCSDVRVAAGTAHTLGRGETWTPEDMQRRTAAEVSGFVNPGNYTFTALMTIVLPAADAAARGGTPVIVRGQSSAFITRQLRAVTSVRINRSPVPMVTQVGTAATLAVPDVIASLHVPFTLSAATSLDRDADGSVGRYAWTIEATGDAQGQPVNERYQSLHMVSLDAASPTITLLTNVHGTWTVTVWVEDNDGAGTSMELFVSTDGADDQAAPPAQASTPGSGTEGGISAGALAGSVIAAFVVALLLALAAWYFFARKKEEEPEAQPLAQSDAAEAADESTTEDSDAPVTQPQSLADEPGASEAGDATAPDAADAPTAATAPASTEDCVLEMDAEGASERAAPSE